MNHGWELNHYPKVPVYVCKRKAYANVFTNLYSTTFQEIVTDYVGIACLICLKMKNKLFKKIGYTLNMAS